MAFPFLIIFFFPQNVGEMQGHICSIILLFAGLLLELHVKSSEVWQGLLPVHLGASIILCQL